MKDITNQNCTLLLTRGEVSDRNLDTGPLCDHTNGRSKARSPEKSKTYIWYLLGQVPNTLEVSKPVWESNLGNHEKKIFSRGKKFPWMEKNFHVWKKNFHTWKKISMYGNFKWMTSLSHTNYNFLFAAKL